MPYKPATLDFTQNDNVEILHELLPKPIFVLDLPLHNKCVVNNHQHLIAVSTAVVKVFKLY